MFDGLITENRSVKEFGEKTLSFRLAHLCLFLFDPRRSKKPWLNDRFSTLATLWTHRDSFSMPFHHEWWTVYPELYLVAGVMHRWIKEARRAHAWETVLVFSLVWLVCPSSCSSCLEVLSNPVHASGSVQFINSKREQFAYVMSLLVAKWLAHREGHGFDFQVGHFWSFLCGVCMHYSCLHGFAPGQFCKEGHPSHPRKKPYRSQFAVAPRNEMTNELRRHYIDTCPPRTLPVNRCVTKWSTLHLKSIQKSVNVLWKCKKNPLETWNLLFAV